MAIDRQVKDLEIGDDPVLSMWAQCNHKGSYKRKAVRSESEKSVEVEAGLL